MYDVMIIDDDKSIRDRLKSIIDWEDLDIRLVCEAQDSDTARELFFLNRPKILITDIHIPIISGLELAQEIAAIDPEVRFIVITGYSDFDYAKASVKLGAVDLISKPIMQTDINASLKKAVAYFERIKSEQTSSQNIQLLLEESLPTLREKFVYYILNQTRSHTSEEILEKFTALRLDISGRYYTIALISFTINSLSSADMDLGLVAAKNMSDELLREADFKVYSFYDNNYRLNCLLAWDFENGNEILEETILNIHEKMGFYWNIEVYAGIGMPVEDISHIHDARHEAYIALNYQGVLGSGPIINHKNIVRLDTPLIADKTKVITHAVMCFKNNDLHEMSAVIRNEIIALLSSTQDYIQPARKFIFEFISSVIAESISLGINTETITRYSDIYEKIFSIENIQSLIQYVVSFAENISKELLKKRSESKNMLIKMAKDFIINNLGNEKLNLEMVSGHIGLSSIYFCKLFHKEESISFNDYLNQERVNKAKKLLSETSMKVFEISYATGYGNPKHFNYVFKRLAGMTPLEYRNA